MDLYEKFNNINTLCLRIRNKRTKIGVYIVILEFLLNRGIDPSVSSRISHHFSDTLMPLICEKDDRDIVNPFFSLSPLFCFLHDNYSKITGFEQLSCDVVPPIVDKLSDDVKLVSSPQDLLPSPQDPPQIPSPQDPLPSCG